MAGAQGSALEELILLFPAHKKTQPLISFLGKVLPSAVMGLYVFIKALLTLQQSLLPLYAFSITAANGTVQSKRRYSEPAHQRR